MAQVVVRQLEDDVKARIQRRARRHGRSMEEEVREILRNAANQEGPAATNLGSRIAARFRKCGITKDWPELHGHRAIPPDFSK